MRKALSSIEIMLSDKQSDNLKSDMTNIKTSLIHLSEDIGNIQGKVDIIANDVVDIKSIVISMNKMITERKEFMDMYFSVHAEDDEEADMMISKFTTMIAEQVINQGMQKWFGRITTTKGTKGRLFIVRLAKYSF